jgi:hypothetical protein
MSYVERELADGLQGCWVEPDERCSTGVVLLAGSSGKAPAGRARLIAALGCRVVALRWFGGAGQSPGICEIPLELFETALDRLSDAGCQRIAIAGTSKGAEAALLVSSFDHRVTLTVAFSPSSAVWANVGPGHDGFEWPLRSSLTRQGIPFAFSHTWRKTSYRYAAYLRSDGSNSLKKAYRDFRRRSRPPRSQLNKPKAT